MKKKLFEYDAIKLTYHNGKERWHPKARPCMKNNDDLEILCQYNGEIRGFYNYYSLANNSYTIDSFYNIMEYSMYKTYACKYKSSVRKVLRKYSKNGEFGVDYIKKNGKTVRCEFYHDGFKRKPLSRIKFNDDQPLIKITRTSLIDRIKANKCEICGAESVLSMHHVKKLKDLQGKRIWEKHMIARRRKTIAVCHDCHWKIHSPGLYPRSEGFIFFKQQSRRKAHNRTHNTANADRNRISNKLWPVIRSHYRKRQYFSNSSYYEKLQNKSYRHHNGKFMQGKQKGFSTDASGVKGNIVDNHTIYHNGCHDDGKYHILKFVFGHNKSSS